MKKTLYVRGMLSLLALTATVTPALPVSAETFRFGIMADTQWKADLDGENPNTVAVGIIRQLNEQFIEAGVKFVIQVGDLTDKGDNPGAMATRAEAAQELCDNGIGFYPLRGNHESSQNAALLFQGLYPQTVGAGGCGAAGAVNFSSPFATLAGLSYSFDYDTTRFVLIDQFTRTDGTNYQDSSNNNLLDQLQWIEARLSGKDADANGFVFSHKNLIGANHVDTIFGSNPAVKPDEQNSYFHMLAANGVRYQIGGHDHNHLRSMVMSPNGETMVQNIITSSNSYKFYTPKVPSIDEQYNLPTLGMLRETPIVQELYTVGYYIVTVDGPQVTVDHYASDNGCGGTLGNSVDCDLTVTPDLHFEKRETFGYSLNGQEFLVAQGASYRGIEDRFEGTTARILDGSNGSTVHLYDGRATTRDVTTGWSARSVEDRKKLASNVLTLWGMADLGTEVADTYVLSMSYDKTPTHLGNGAFGLASRNAHGRWVNAVELNAGGTKNFVHGPYKPGYALGSYGVDPVSKTAWAVVNYSGDFAVGRDIEAVPGQQKK
ncbi:MAG: metallophosphoesterase [Desulfopila sp.]